MNEFIIPIFNWKLTTLSEYVQVVVLLVVSFFALYLYTKRAKQKRHKAPAVQKVAKRLSSALQPQCKVLANTALLIDGELCPVDIVTADKYGILLIEVYGRGLEIYGDASSETWKLVDREQSHSVANPLPRLEEYGRSLKQLLAKEGLFGVSVLPLAVFADNFEEPKLFLGKTEAAVTYEQLRRYLKSRSQDKRTVDVDKLFVALEAIAVKRQKEELT